MLATHTPLVLLFSFSCSLKPNQSQWKSPGCHLGRGFLHGYYQEKGKKQERKVIGGVLFWCGPRPYLKWAFVLHVNILQETLYAGSVIATCLVPSNVIISTEVVKGYRCIARCSRSRMSREATDKNIFLILASGGCPPIKIASVKATVGV